MNRAGSFRVACFIRVPLRAHSNLNLSFAIDIARSNRDVVELCKVFRHDEPLPVTIAIPDDLLFVGEQNIRSAVARSEEHTSELQSRGHLVCRLLLEKKNK